MQREKYIDVAKGIGIILVILGHVINLNDFNSMEPVSNIIYSFHMPLFFLISGYCVGMKENFADTSFSQQIKKIFFRLIVPYIVWSFIYIFLSNNMTNIERYTAIFTFRGIAPLWFLPALALCEFSFFCIAKLLRKLKNNQQIAIVSLIAIVCVLIGLIVNTISTENFSTIGNYLFITIGRLFISLPSYILGFILARTKLVKSIGKIGSLAGGVILISVVVAMVLINDLSTNFHLLYTNNYWIFTLTSLCGAAGVLLFSYSIGNYSRVLSFLGQNSLGLMILHYLPFKTIEYSSKAIISIWDNEIFVSILSTVITTVITLLGIYLIKKKFFLYK